MCHTLHCIQQGLCLSFLSFSPPAEPTCCLALSRYFRAPSRALCNGRWFTFLSPQHGQLMHMPELPSMLHYPHARAFSVNLFSSVKVSFPFLRVSQALWLLQFLTWALHLSLSILLAGSRFLLCLPTPKPQVPASNWPHISFLRLAPQLLPSLPYRLTYFISLSINIFVFPGLLSATCNNVYAVSIFALFLLDLDSFNVYFYFQYHYFLFHTFLLFSVSPRISPSRDTYFLAPSDVSSLIFIFANLYITTNKLSL